MKMRQRIFAAITAAVAVVLALLAALGLDAALHLKQPDASLASRALAALHQPGAPDGPDWPELTDERQITPFLSAFKANGVGLGNSPYQELKTDEASINHVVDGCLEMKPNLRKTLSFFRSELFNNFDPLNYFYDSERQLPDDVRQFLDRYSFRKVQLTSNANGERLTLPAIQSPDKILVAGDSMGMSAMVNDDETLASQLQAADPAHQYINIGVSGASAEDIVCALKRAAKRYPGQIRAVIYPFCENDFEKKKPYGTPESLVAWLAEFKRENRIDDVTIVYMPFIYNSVPELTRIPGQKEFNWPRHGTEKARLLALARQAGFRTFDFTRVTEAEKRSAGSEYAALALYVDQTHLSRFGIRRLVDLLMAKNS